MASTSNKTTSVVSYKFVNRGGLKCPHFIFRKKISNTRPLLMTGGVRHFILLLLVSQSLRRFTFGRGIRVEQSAAIASVHGSPWRRLVGCVERTKTGAGLGRELS